VTALEKKTDDLAGALDLPSKQSRWIFYGQHNAVANAYITQARVLHLGTPATRCCEPELFERFEVMPQMVGSISRGFFCGMFWRVSHCKICNPTHSPSAECL